jgi:hypothetical protein
MKEFQWRREQLNNSIAKVQKKWELYNRSAGEFEAALRDLSKKVDFLDNIWISLEESITRVATREIRQLERENGELKKQVSLREEIDHHGIEIGSTWAVFSFLFDHISDNNPDVRMVLDSALFGSVCIPLMQGNSDLIVDTLPSCVEELVYEGKEVVKLTLEEAQRSLKIPEVWGKNAPFLQEWVLDNMIPIVVGHRLELREILSYEDMILWSESPGDRDTFFPELFDMYELYRKNKAQIFKELRIAETEAKLREFIDENN